MQRYCDFDELRSSAKNAIQALADKAGLDWRHPLVTYAMLDALAEPLWMLKAHGGVVVTRAARAGLDACTTSILARRVEELKSPHSLSVNGVMDQIVDALSEGQQPFITHPEAFVSATQYLVDGGVIETAPDGTLRLIEEPSGE